MEPKTVRRGLWELDLTADPASVRGRKKIPTIEHRLFPHTNSAYQGAVFHPLAIAKQFMEKAKTSTGLMVAVEVLAGVYATEKCAQFLCSDCRRPRNT